MVDLHGFNPITPFLAIKLQIFGIFTFKMAKIRILLDFKVIQGVQRGKMPQKNRFFGENRNLSIFHQIRHINACFGKKYTLSFDFFKAVRSWAVCSFCNSIILSYPNWCKKSIYRGPPLQNPILTINYKCTIGINKL